MDRSRKLILDLLIDLEDPQVFANEALTRALQEQPFDLQERRFISAILYGVLTYQATLDRHLQTVMKKTLSGLSTTVRNLLRLGLYQLDYAYSVPPEVAVYTTVQLAKDLNLKGRVAFINGVLRSLSRERSVFLKNERPLRYGLTNELYGLLKKDYGVQGAERMAEAFLTAGGPVAIRVNRLKTSPKALIKRLEKEGVKAQKSPLLTSALRLSLEGQDLSSLPSFKEGLWTVQAEGPQVLGELAPCVGVECVLDSCAAPGGKTGHLIERLGDKALVRAAERSSRRLRRLYDLKERMGYQRLELLERDATHVLPEAERRVYDLVVLDVPCSASGLLGKQPELRRRVTYQRVQDLLPLQKAILKAQAEGVKVGGYLLYATCSVFSMENSEQVKSFLTSLEGQDFQTADVHDRCPEALREKVRFLGRGELVCSPENFNGEGFYLALMKRVK